MKKSLHRTPIWKIVAYTLCILFVIVTVLPLIWMAYSSFKTQGEIARSPLALPQFPTIKNYVDAWKLGGMGRKFLNSIIYTGVATIFTILFALSSGFGLSKFPFKSKRVYYGLFTIGLLITVNSVMIPLFIIETRLNLYNSYVGIILPYIAFALPATVLIAVSYLKGIPDAIIEAAHMDGAHYLQIFFYIIIPMSMPIMGTIAILTFLQNWNEFLLVFILTNGDAMKSLPVAVNSFAGRLNVNYGLQFAALTMSTFPMILFYIVAHKYVIKSYGEGGVKE